MESSRQQLESNPLGDACMDQTLCLDFSDDLSSFLPMIPV